MTYRQVLRLAGATFADDLREARAEIQWEIQKRQGYSEQLGPWVNFNRLMKARTI